MTYYVAFHSFVIPQFKLILSVFAFYHLFPIVVTYEKLITGQSLVICDFNHLPASPLYLSFVFLGLGVFFLILIFINSFLLVTICLVCLFPIILFSVFPFSLL